MPRNYLTNKLIQQGYKQMTTNIDKYSTIINNFIISIFKGVLSYPSMKFPLNNKNKFCQLTIYRFRDILCW